MMTIKMISNFQLINALYWNIRVYETATALLGDSLSVISLYDNMIRSNGQLFHNIYLYIYIWNKENR